MVTGDGLNKKIDQELLAINVELKPQKKFKNDQNSKITKIQK